MTARPCGSSAGPSERTAALSLRVRAEVLDKTDILACVHGTSNLLAPAHRPDGHRRNRLHLAWRGANGLRRVHRSGRCAERASIRRTCQWTAAIRVSYPDSVKLLYVPLPRTGPTPACSPRRGSRRSKKSTRGTARASPTICSRLSARGVAGIETAGVSTAARCRNHAPPSLPRAAQDLVHRPQLPLARRGHPGRSAGGAGQFHEARVVHVPAGRRHRASAAAPFRTTWTPKASWA